MGGQSDGWTGEFNVTETSQTVRLTLCIFDSHTLFSSSHVDITLHEYTKNQDKYMREHVKYMRKYVKYTREPGEYMRERGEYMTK